MPIKKSELYSALWESCDQLRGGMDASQYKDYVLVLLFVKYVSDKYAGQKHALLDVPKGGGFADMLVLKGHKDIGEGMNKIIAKLAEANDLKGVIDVADFNDPDKLGGGKEMVDRLSNLVGIFADPRLDFRKNKVEGDDLLGDAYEYLMRHFATQSGKSKGQFYTPAEVSRVMAKVIGVGSARAASQTIHDPTCGSASLLLRAHDEAKSRTGHDLTLYGQEMDNATKALAKMNMILHDCPTAEIWQDNVLANPHFLRNDGSLKTFDFVVANPPFSFKAWSNGFNPAEDPFKRFAFGVPPAKNGDTAFLLHILACLKSTGKAAVNLPHGVLFRGNAEADIRREIVRRGYIKGIIGLPPNLFYGTGIPACIVVLDKEHAAGRTGIFMVDASKGFIKDGNKNRLRAQDIHKIVDAFTRQVDIPRYSRLVPLAEIENNEFNLNLPRYVDSNEPEDLHDIDAHLRGGIPVRDIDALDTYWQVFPGVRDALFEAADRPGYCRLRIAAADIKATIFSHPEFTAFVESVTALFEKWRKKHVRRLMEIAVGDRPKALIETLSEDLLATFKDARLLDAYDVYQHLMDYWEATMQDDVYMIASEGWVKAATPRLIVEDKEKKTKEKPDFVHGKLKFKAELVPTVLIGARWFSAEQVAVEQLEGEVAAFEQKLGELKEGHGGEEGLLAEAIDDKGGISQAAAVARRHEIQDDADAADEREVLDAYLAFLEQRSETTKKLKDAARALEVRIASKYGDLVDSDIKIFVVCDKWLPALTAAVDRELDRVSELLTGRIRQLAERYATPLPQITAQLEMLSGRVKEHLEKMGAMRELLNGQSRLPGFHGTWEMKRIDEMGYVLAGKALNALGAGHLRPYLRTKNVLDGRIDLEDVLEMPFTDAEFDRFRVVYGDVLLNEGQSLDLVGRCAMYRGELPSPCAMQNQLLRFRAKQHTSPEYAEHLFRHCQHTGVFSAIATQTTSVAHLGSTRFSQLRLLWPSDPAEQRAIATVLSDMDAEIAALEAWRDKTQALKQGLMQELLGQRAARVTSASTRACARAAQ